MATRKSKAVVASIALAALAATGTTLALWDDSATFDDTTIYTGHLDLTAGAKGIYDASLDDAEHPAGHVAADWHTIDLSTWRSVPGDVIVVTQAITVDLEGENIAAKLDIKNPAGVSLVGDAAKQAAAAADGGLYVSGVKLYEGTPTAAQLAAGEATEVTIDADGVTYLRQPTAPGDHGDAAALDDDTTKATTFTVVYEVTFDVNTPGSAAGATDLNGGAWVDDDEDADTPDVWVPAVPNDNKHMDSSVTLDGFTVELTQVRPAQLPAVAP